jgi:hypothetical protein
VRSADDHPDKQGSHESSHEQANRPAQRVAPRTAQVSDEKHRCARGENELDSDLQVQDASH